MTERPRGTRSSSWVLLAGAAIIGLGLGLALWRTARPAPSASLHLLADQSASRKAPAAHPLAAYPHWGGAWSSASEDGRHFFDFHQAMRFKTQAGKRRKYVVHLNARALLPDPKAPLAQIVPAKGEQLVYLQCVKPPTAPQRAALKKTGVELGSYVTGLAWAARGTREAFAAARKLPFVRALARVDPRDKLHHAVFEGQRPAHALTKDGKLRYFVLATRGTPLAALAQTAQSAGAALKPAYKSALGERFELSGDLKAVLALAANPRTLFFEYIPPPVAPRDSTLDQAHNINDVRDEGLLLDGSGVAVAVREVQKIVPHADFDFRYTDNDFFTSTPDDPNHATAVTGQIGGDGSTVPSATGVAPNCELFGYDIDEPNAFDTADIEDADFFGARISNHSYGPLGEGDGSYTTVSADWDAAIRAGALDEGLVVVLAGNEQAPVNFKQIDDFVGCKNGICVTASNDSAHAGDDNPPTPVSPGIASFADHGPMVDGRVKPDLTANGDSVFLLQGMSGSQTSTGTSFACPAVSGIAALLFQEYITRSGGEPSAALAKALLLNTATDVGSLGPDATYGFGLANAEKVIATIDRHFDNPTSDPVIFENTLNSGDPDWTVNIFAGSDQPLKVMLVWMDPAGNPAANPALVNDLDLEVLPPGASPPVFPFSLDPANPGNAATNSGPNTVDNVEQVIIPSPTAGTYQVRVKATSIPSGPQPFAVVVVKGAAQPVFITAVPAAPGTVQNGKVFLPVGGGDVTFTANINSGTPPYKLDWDFDGDSTVDRTDNGVAASPFTTAPVTYSAGANTYTVTLTVTDNTLAVFTATLDVEVLAPPVAIITAAPPGGEAPLQVFLSGGLSTGQIATYDWVFGDSSGPESNTIPTTTHTFTGIGTFTVMLTVTDVVGQPDTTTQDITTTKRIVNAFGHRFRGRVNFVRNRGSIVMILVAPELALTRAARRQAIQNGTFEGKTYNVGVDLALVGPMPFFNELGSFTTNKYARAAAPGKRFRISLKRGWIIIRYAVPGDALPPPLLNVADVFRNLGMDKFTPSTDPLDPFTDLPVFVSVETGDVRYDSSFNVIWRNIRELGRVGRARNRRP